MESKLWQLWYLVILCGFPGATKMKQLQNEINEVDWNHWDILSANIKRNSDAIEDLSETLIRTKRGIAEEKKDRRKMEVKELAVHLEKIRERQNIMNETQNKLIQNQKQMMKDHADLVNQVQYIVKENNGDLKACNKSTMKAKVLEEKRERQKNEFSSLRVSQSQMQESKAHLLKSVSEVKVDIEV